MSDSKLSFSKEIATTLGLEEAILLEYFKATEEQQNPASFNQICSDLTFWPSQKIKDLLNNCLLYTSPSPRDVEESRMPSSA